MTDHTSSHAELSRGKIIAAGLLSGVVAALLLTLCLLLLRNLFGIPTPSELIGDRLAAALSVETFIKLLTQSGGYNQLKQIGFGSVLAGQLVVGALGGLAYALIVARKRAQGNAEDASRLGTTRGGLIFVCLFVGGLWLVSLLLLWPVLGTNYYGKPPGPASVLTAIAWLIAYALCGLALIVCYGFITRRAMRRVEAAENETSGAHAAAHTGRRAVIAGGVGVVFALAAGALMRRLYGLATFSYDGTQYKGADVQYVTPVDRFYVVTKNVIDPQADRDAWRLEIGGMVDRPRSYTFAELAALPSVMQETTLMCISNEVGGGLISNAVWKGVSLASLLKDASPQAGVKEVFLHGVDNYSDTFSVEKALDPATLVVYEMNGAPLTERHGYPVRVIVPGLFGEKNVKWITRIELVAEDAKGFYEQQGWGPNFIIPTHARFDAPDFSKPVMAGAGVALKGMAFAGSRGVSKVEVSLDDGKTWQGAQLSAPGTKLTWALWQYDWRPDKPGEYKLSVRATDGDGATQTKDERGTVPQGATGYHKVTARVMA